MADTAPSVPGFFDGFGDRLVVTDRSARALEVLRLRPELVSDPGFETAVRARAALLAQFQHAGCTHVRHVGRLPGGDGRLALVSDFVTGWRLSEVLQAAEQLNIALHTNAVLFLLRQLVSVVSDLHALGPDVSHGALGPERIVLTPTGRLVVTEHVFGSALPFVPSVSPQRAWRDLRLAVPADEQPPFGRRSDILQVGLCGLALVLSRPLRLDDYPQRLRDLIDRATESKLTGERRPLRPALRAWFEQVLGFAPEAAAVTIHHVREGLDRLVSREGYLATPTGLVALLESVEAYCAGDLLPAAAVPDTEPGEEPAVAEARVAEAATPHAVAVPAPPDDGAWPAPGVEDPSPVLSPPPAGEPIEAPPSPADGGTAIWEEAPAPVPMLALEAPVSPTSPGREAQAERPGSEPLRTADDDGLDLAPGPRPAWPAEPEVAGEAESFAPEPGFAFTPDDPGLDEMPVAQPVPVPPSGQCQSASIAAGSDPAGREPAHAAGHELSWPPRVSPPSGPQETVRVRPSPSGAFEVTPPPPVPRASGASSIDAADSPVEPIAASVSEAPESRHSGAHGPSGRWATSRGSRSLFGAPHDEGEAVAEEPKPSRARWIAAAAVGCVALAGTLGGWALMGTSAKEPADNTRAAVSRNARDGSQAGRDARERPDEAARPSPAPVESASAPAASQPLEVAAVPTGAVRVLAPFPVDIFEDGTKVGAGTGPFELTAGRHRLELVNEELQFRSLATVDVRAAGRVRVQPAIPQGSANINAIPWAEVWIDGTAAGETPLGNLSLPIGFHQVVFRHPQLGEQTRTLVVTTAGTARLSVEMKQ